MTNCFGFRCWNFTTFMMVSGLGGFFNSGVFTLQTVELGSNHIDYLCLEHFANLY